MAARIVSPKQLGAIPFVSGEGLKVYAVPTDAPWYGSGYCSICGGEPFPARVRYWDPDDGWRSGVLCVGCADECSERGPRADDYAVMAARNASARSEWTSSRLTAPGTMMRPTSIPTTLREA